MNENKILILDIETTNISRFKGHIVEVGIVELDLTNGNRKIVFDSVCFEKGITEKEIEDSWIYKNSKPTLSIPAIKYANNLEKLKPYIQGILNSYPLGCTAFNNVFDFNWFENRGFVFPKKLPCIMLSLQKSEIWTLSKRPNVEEAYELLTETKLNESHRGADDAWHEALIAYKLYIKNYFKIT